MAGAFAPTTPPRSRSRYTDADVSVKLRVSHLVGGADFEPNELPPAAILIVRRVADPLPRGLSGGESGGKFALGASPEWERAARSALGEIARAAVRPSRGTVPSNANAVLFADQAELLACFSRDYLRGGAASLWWWRAVLRSLPGTGSRALFETWRQNIRYVPAVVARLAELGDVACVLRSFTPEQARTILQEAARTFDLRDVLAIAEGSWGSWERKTAQTDSSGGVASSIRDTAVYGQKKHGPVPPPWRESRTIEVLSAGLSREHAALLGVLLELCQSPCTVRSRRFAAELERWWRSSSSTSVSEDEPVERPQPVPAAFDGSNASHDRGRQNETSVFADVASSGMLSSEAQLPERPTYHISSPEDSQLTTRSEVTASNGEGFQRGLMTAAHDTELSEEKRSSLSPRPEAESQESQVLSGYGQEPEVKAMSQLPGYVEPSEQVPQLASSIEQQRLLSDTEATLKAGDCVITELSGVFFLVNLLKALGIPELLDHECHCELGLGSWECLELIARCLLSASRPDLAKDPVWSVLSILDGRSPEQRPGERFRPASFYRLPESLLLNEGISTTTAAVRVRRNRFEIWSHLGFPLAIYRLDEPLSAHDIRCFAQGSSLTSFKQVPRLWSGARAVGVSPASPLRNFLAFLMPFVRWRLAASLGLKSKGKPDLTNLLLSRPGKVWATATHLDVVMPLKHATSAVRFAGLDADPGWVPVFGRVIKFHYQ